MPGWSESRYKGGGGKKQVLDMPGWSESRYKNQAVCQYGLGSQRAWLKEAQRS